MTKAIEEVLALSEKVVDSTIKIGGLSLLGLEIPKSVEDVGVLGAAFSIMKIGSYIRDSQFERSFQKLASELDSLTFEQKQNFFNKYPKKDVVEFGEQAILLLNKIEMPLAASMMGKAHYLLVLGEITKYEYFNYCHVIKNINNYLFNNLCTIYTSDLSEIYEGGLYSLLEGLGLLKEHQQPSYAGRAVEPTRKFECSDFGKSFFKSIVEPFMGLKD